MKTQQVIISDKQKELVQELLDWIDDKFDLGTREFDKLEQRINEFVSQMSGTIIISKIRSHVLDGLCINGIYHKQYYLEKILELVCQLTNEDHEELLKATPGLEHGIAFSKKMIKGLKEKHGKDFPKSALSRFAQLHLTQNAHSSEETREYQVLSEWLIDIIEAGLAFRGLHSNPFDDYF